MIQFSDKARKELEEIRKTAKIRHERARKAAKRQGRQHFPLLPYECSWAFEEDFRRELEQRKSQNFIRFARYLGLN